MAMRSLRSGDEVQLRVSEKVGWVDGCVSYANTSGGSYIVDTEKHGRFAVSQNHEDLREKE